MSLSEEKGYYTIQFNSPAITEKDIKFILNTISRTDESDILIDMTGVERCVNNFFKIFQTTKKRISIINTDSQILATLYMMNFDKYIKVYNEQVSFQCGRNELKNRRLSVVK